MRGRYHTHPHPPFYPHPSLHTAYTLQELSRYFTRTYTTHSPPLPSPPMGCCQTHELEEKEQNSLEMTWCAKDVDVQLDDAELFYESLERTRSKLGSEPGSQGGISNMSLLSLLGRHTGAQDLMADALDLMWEVRSLAAGLERNDAVPPIPAALKSQVVRAVRTLTHIGGRLTSSGVTIESQERTSNRSFNSVESWRRGVPASRVKRDDNPLGRSHTRRSLKKAMTEVDAACEELREHHIHIASLHKALAQWSAEHRVQEG